MAVNRFRSTKTLEKLSIRPVRYFFIFFIAFAVLAGTSFLLHSYRVTLAEHRQRLASFNQLEVQDTLMTFEQYETLLRITGNRLVEAGVDSDPEQGRQAIESMKAVNQILVGFGIARPDGQLLLVSTIPDGVALPNLLQNEQTRAGYLEALESHHLVLGRTHYMKYLKQWVIPMRVALRATPDSPPHHIMAAGLPLTNQSPLWSNDLWKQGIVTTVIRAGDGFIQSRNPLNEEFDTLFATPVSSEVLDILNRVRNRPGAVVSIRSRMMAAVNYLPKYDLFIVTEQPTALLYQNWLKTSMPLLLVLLGTAGLSVLVFRYISRLYRQAQSQLIFQATHDSLTGLPNRRMLYDQVEQKIAESFGRQQVFGVMFLDLDNFKRINDNFGHSVGDDVLKKMARRLLQDEDCWAVGRQGGDEFIVITETIHSENEIHRIARNLLKIAERSMAIENYEINLGTSVGVSLYPQDGSDADTLLRCADTALYKSKGRKRGQYLFYSEEMNQQAQRRLLVENQLRKSIERQELSVHYQPLYHPQSGTVPCCEALLRWTNQELGVVSPNEFITVAEESGLIEELGLFVLQRAVSDVLYLNQQRTQPLTVAVNLSTKQLLYSPIVWHLQELLAVQDVDPAVLKIEITESVLIEDFDKAIGVLRQIRQLGIHIAIDDFGTGYSSLAYLSKLPCEEIKIDRGFIQNLLTHRDDESLVQSIIAMAKALNRTVVAEGVETAEHLEKLAEFGCDYIQGYYISRPLPLEEFEQVLERY